MSTKLTEVLHVRISPELLQRLEAESQRLGLRPADIARVVLAKGIGPGNEQPVPAAGKDAA